IRCGVVAFAARTGDWIEREREGVAPAPRRRHVLEYFESSQSVLLVGDADVGEYWRRDLSTDARGSVIVELAWSAAGFQSPDDAGGSAEVVDALTLTLGARGEGYDTATDGDLVGTAIEGFVVEAWDAQTLSWTEIGASNASGVDALSLTRVGDDARRLVFPGTGNIHLRVLPASGSGNGGRARIELDFAEVSVDYTAP
ncbi:MAG: hypothetical protein AAFQ82_04970, partial [Myxococcota bacterium]